MSDLIKLGGLWVNKDKDGKTYLTGKLSPTVKVLIFPNKFRETENQPNYIMYISAVEQQPRGDDFPPSDGDDFFGDEPAPIAPENVRPTPAPRSDQRRAPAPSAARPAPRPARPTPPPGGRMVVDEIDRDLEDPFAE